jgi:enoyl-CoA hydratase/carnithine racemase
MNWSGKDFAPQHFRWDWHERVATITLNRPERRNPLTFDSYDELGRTFRNLGEADDVRAVVITGAGDHFCSGGDVHEIIGPLTERDDEGLLAFTRLTGELVKAMRAAPQPIIAAVDGTCAGAGAILAMASDLRYATPRTKTAVLFVKVGLSGADMGACAILPRIIGQGRASELLYTGRVMTADEGSSWGFYNALCAPDDLVGTASEIATQLAAGPTIAHATTKACLHREWDMAVDDAIDTEAEAQAACMRTQDFRRAFEAFAKKETPIFEGN